MANRKRGDRTNSPSATTQPNWIVGRIKKIKRQFHERRTKKKKEHSQDRSSRRTATATVWIAIFAVVAAVVGFSQAIIGNRQLTAMQGQLDTMETDKRPWVKIDVAASELIFSDWNGSKQASVRLRFNLKNYGTSPAINIQIVPIIDVHPGNTRRRELDIPQKVSCVSARAQADENPISGIAIFPSDQSSPVDMTLGIGIRMDSPILYSVYGCVDYTYGNDRHGQTGFRMVLGQIVRNQIVGIPFVEGEPHPYEEPISPEFLAQGFPVNPPRIATLKPDQFFFREDNGGNYAK